MRGGEATFKLPVTSAIAVYEANSIEMFLLNCRRRYLETWITTISLATDTGTAAHNVDRPFAVPVLKPKSDIEDKRRVVNFPKQGNSGLQILSRFGRVFNAFFRFIDTERSGQMAAETGEEYSGEMEKNGAKRVFFEVENGLLYVIDDSCVICLRSVYGNIGENHLLHRPLASGPLADEKKA